MSSVLCLLVLCALSTVAVRSSSLYSLVVQDVVLYSCCTPPQVIVKEHCTNTWIMEGETIAHIEGSTRVCDVPCQELDDKMTLHGCINVVTVIVCKVLNMTVEERILYNGQSCQSPRSNRTGPQTQGCVALLLLALVIAGFFTKC